jgi:hypothetical protein
MAVRHCPDLPVCTGYFPYSQLISVYAQVNPTPQEKIPAGPVYGYVKGYRKTNLVTCGKSCWLHLTGVADDRGHGGFDPKTFSTCLIK